MHTSADLERHRYSAESAAELYRRLTARAARVPGVQDVSFTSHVPLTGGVVRTNVTVEGQGPSSRMVCTYTAVSPGYFRTLEIAFASGRDFTSADAAGAPVAIVSEALARRFWPESHALGKRVMIDQRPTPLTVVGIVRDAADASLFREKGISLYVPASTSAALNLQLLVKTTGDIDALASALRLEAASYDRNIRFEVAPLADVLRLWILPSRVAAIAATVLGVIALAMASIGVDGVIAYAVSQRTRELGVRVALGARRADLRRLVLADGVRLVATGVALGLGGAAAMTRMVSSILPGARALDPLPFAAAVIVLAAVAMVACYLPARAASAVDPLSVLRTE